MSNIIIGIHGLSNKPAPALLENWWEMSILEGLKKNRGIDRDSINYKSVYWADVMYPAHDSNPDAYHEAEHGSLKKYKDSWIDYLRAKALEIPAKVIDTMKEIFDMNTVANEVLERKLKDLYEYYTDQGKRTELRKRLKSVILENKEKRIMLVAHSMGSIVAYDTLRELGKENPHISVAHLVTIGSPLGLPHVKCNIMNESPLVRTPSIVKKWTNMADRRDPVAMDIYLKDDYEKNDAGVRVKDDLVMNDWEGIHHKSYGYLRTPEFTDIVRSFI